MSISGIGTAGNIYSKSWGKKADTTNLSYEESQILQEIKREVSAVDAGVDVTDGRVQPNGMTIEVMGFNIYGHDGFVISSKQLKRMAEDEEYKKETLENIKNFVKEEQKNQRQAASIGNSRAAGTNSSENISGTNQTEFESSIITNSSGEKVLMINSLSINNRRAQVSGARASSNSRNQAIRCYLRISS